MVIHIGSVKFAVLFSVSLLLFLEGLYFLFLHNKFRKNSPYSTEKRIIIFTGLLFCATWCIKYAVGLSGVLDPDAVLKKPEELFDSFVHTLQSFSLDEDYSSYLTKGKSLVAALYSNSPFMIRLYACYTSVLNVLCPVAGGAIILAILTSIFPRVKLWLMTLAFWKPICYFSELNEYSLAMAKSLRKNGGKWKKAQFVFTDVYTDSDDEMVTERIQKAKLLKSVCLRDDIADVAISKRKRKCFFLMDCSEVGSLHALTCFKDERKLSRLKRRDVIYLFGNDNGNELVVRSMRECFDAKLGKGCAAFVGTIDSTRNLVYRLLERLPLTYALDKDSDSLNLTVFGSGQIGTEMFLAAYWCGQLLNQTLHITVVSKEKKNDFIARINHINPDIFASADSNSELLRLYPDDPSSFAPVYFLFDYVETDIRKDDLYSKMQYSGPNGRMIDSDYFLIALGSDQENLEIADMVGRFVTVNSLEKPTREIPIAYVVYDDELNATLCDRASRDSLAVKLYPFGSLGDTFSYEDIILQGIRDRAAGINDTYQRVISEKTAGPDAVKKLYKDPYTYWANITRAIHISYKAFSVGMTVEEYAAQAADMNSSLNRNHELAWLEHRRWNAYMRTKGFRAPSEKEEKSMVGSLPDADENDLSNRGRHKLIPLRLHPCIVECDKNGMKPDLFAPHAEKDDMLDKMSLRFACDYAKKNFGKLDYKKYDYPFFDL